MKKKIKIISIIIFAFILLMIFSTESLAGSQRLHSLEFDVVLNKDGSADITETWDITATETNTLFKDFEVYSMETGKYNIIDPVVKDLSTGTTYKKINVEKYHVDPGCYYGLLIDSNTYEIAWNIGADNTTKRKKYEISYKVQDAIQNGVDCSQFYWQFIADVNGMKAENVSATIKLPKPLQTETECKMYAHGPLYGTIHQTDSYTVVAKIPELDANTMFEVRIVMPRNIFTNNKNDNYLTLKGIVEEETVWANEANELRERDAAREKVIKIVSICIYIFNLFLVYCLINNIKKYLRTKKEYQVDTIEYFRDIPYDNATPGECIFMTKGNISYSDSSKLIMATILNLSLKEIIELEEYGKDTVINLKNVDYENVALKKEELEILKILNGTASSRGTNKITFDDISDYIEDNYEREVPRLEGINTIVRSEEIKRGNLDRKTFSIVGLGSLLIVFGVFAATFFMPMIMIISGIMKIMLPIIISVIILIFISVVKGKINAIKKYTIQGSIEREQWKGLCKFMKDYSRLHERGAMDLILWEHYLVFASALGIAEKLLKELKIVYPNFEEDYARKSRIIHVVDSGYYTRSMNRLSSAARSSHSMMYPSESSSGSGGGGGFSGGGGGRRRRRKHGWKIIKNLHARKREKKRAKKRKIQNVIK